MSTRLLNRLGGAVFSAPLNGSCEIFGSTFASIAAGVGVGGGGAIGFDDDGIYKRVSNCTIANNRSNGPGGSIVA